MKYNKALLPLMLSMLLISLSASTPQVWATTPVIKVEPSLSVFGNSAGDPIPPGTNFTVRVTVYNVVDLYGVDLKFRWNKAYLAYVSHVRTTGFELIVKDEPYPADGWYWFAASRMGVPPPPGYTGNIWIFNMTFEIIKQPYDWETGTPAIEPVDTLLDFISTDIADSGAKPISHEVQPATVRIWEKRFTLPAYPVLKVMPEKVENLPECNTFDVNVHILYVNGYYDIAGFDITLFFDPTLIKATAITEGPYLASYAAATFEVVKTIDNVAGKVRYALVQLPPRTMFGAPPSGILFKVTFHVIFESTTYPPPSCPIQISPLSDIALFPHPEIPAPPYWGKPWSMPLEFTTQDGLYVARFKALGRVVDLYVCDFPHPFRGIGPNEPCEAYPPQKVVNLKALVTYNNWPVQYKPVTFEIRDPQGRIVAIRTAFSDENGIASTSYRLPWPCGKYPEMFGVWTVTATVDIYCQVVNDTMRFKLWWPLELLSVTPGKSSYKIGEHMTFTITMRTCFIMSYNATIALVVYDDVGQPIAYGTQRLTYGWNDKTKWCLWKNYTIIIECLTVPKWTAPGIGTVYVSVLTDLPWNGGQALGPEIYATFGLEIP